MATKSVASNSIGTQAFQYVWSALGSADDGAPVDVTDLADLCFQALGTFSTGGTVILEGSLDGGTTWSPLKDPSSTAISKTASGISAVLEHPQKIRPRATGGDVGTAIVCVVFARRTSR
jgi:hypothetical protein